MNRAEDFPQATPTQRRVELEDRIDQAEINLTNAIGWCATTAERQSLRQLLAQMKGVFGSKR